MESEKDIHPDDELILKAKAGDKSAFEALYNRYKRVIYNYVFRLLGSRERAEEIMQDTFVKAYSHLKTYVPIGKVSNWFYAIAGNLSRDVLRHRKYEKTVSLEKTIPLENGEVELMQMIPSRAPDAFELAKRKEIESRLQKALDLLPAKYKMAFVLCVIEGLSLEEAGRILRCNAHAVSTRLGRAKMKLAKILKQAYRD